MKVTLVNIGWFVAGVISGADGIALYKNFTMLGAYYIVLGMVIVVISIVINKVIENYRRIVLKKGSTRKRS